MAPESPVRIPDDFVKEISGYPDEVTAEEVQRRFRTVLGPFEIPSVPLNLRVQNQEVLPGNIVRQRVEYDVEPGERVPAYHLFHADLAPDAPGVLSIHAHGGEETFREGKDAHAHPRPDDPSQYTYRLALAGFRVLAPDALCFGERQSTWGYSRFFFEEIVVHAELCARNRSLAWKSVWDNSRAIEALTALGARRIGSIGHSGGSTQNYILAAVNPAVQAAVCLQSFMTLRHQFYRYRLCHCLYHYIPGMMSAGIDWDQVVALVPPRKIFLGWGARDEGTPEPMYRAFVDAILHRCRSEGLEDSLTVHEEPDHGHEITERMMQDAVSFLRQHLAPGGKGV